MIALAFSGGKDSWACLWLNKDRLHDIHVLWVNTGKNYPEMLGTISKARSMCPNFVEINVDRDSQNATYGIPGDVVPINYTLLGQHLTGEKPVMVQSYLQCCFENIGSQLQGWCERNGVKELIRGQRNSEKHKSPARNGTVLNGVTYIQPIEDWSEKQVLDYVAQHMDLPDHFSLKHSSMDCYDCTAYHKESADRIEYTRQHHPVLFQEYRKRKDALIGAIRDASEAMTAY